MWYNKFNWTILVFLVLFTVVTGSCLEYGHSCWGAHGKRSGNRPINALKTATPYSDNLGDPLLDNNNIDNESNNDSNNNNNPNTFTDDNNNSNNNNNNNNNLYDLAAAMTVGSVEATLRDANEGKWTQLLRQRQRQHQRQRQLRQRQRQHQQRQRQRQLQYEGSAAAAESWRKLQQAMLEADQQQPPLPIVDFFELNNK